MMSKVVKMKAIHNNFLFVRYRIAGVVMMSKVVKMKAIHNQQHRFVISVFGVVMMSKVVKMKAIHNLRNILAVLPFGVVMMSKVVKMKAIHNEGARVCGLDMGVVMMSKVVKMKAIHNTDHYVHQWLKTEYDTAVIRAHQAADWKHFLEEADVFPNIRWMPTTSITPDPLHQHYWEKKLTLPVNHPFWQEHRPGDRWNCKCSLQQTDDPVNASALDGWTPPLPQPGLDNNPAVDGSLFSGNHPYITESYPDAKAAVEKVVRGDPYLLREAHITDEGMERFLKARKELYKNLKADWKYKDVKFDKTSGGISAIHRDHKFSKDRSLLDPSKKKGAYEIEATDALRRKGHVVILASENADTGIKTPDGFLDGILMDIKSFEGIGKTKVKDKLKEAIIQGVKTVVLYFPKKDLLYPGRVSEGWDLFLTDKDALRHKNTIEKVICVVENEVIEWPIPK